MPRRTIKKTAVTESTAEDSGGGGTKKTRQSRGGKSRSRKNNTQETGMGTGTSQSFDLAGPQIPESTVLPKPVLDKAGHPMPRLQCSGCPAGQLLCEQCLYPCSSTSTCKNKSCQLVSTLLTCDQVTDPLSKVKGCPLFRACPKCHSLMMHERGCKYVTCMQCQHSYCFICLQSTDECTKDKTKYWSVTCAVPRAARQRFQT